MSIRDTNYFPSNVVKYILLFATSFILSQAVGQSVDSVRTAILDSVSIVEADTLDSAMVTQALPVKFDSTAYYTRELSFTRYLITSEQYQDALFLLSRLEAESASASSEQRDSIRFMMGWVNYFDQNFEESIYLLSKVSDDSEISTQAKFYKSICFVYLMEYDQAKQNLNEITLDSGSLEWELKMFQLGAIALLERDYNSFDSLSPYFSENHFQFSIEEQSMLIYHEELSSYKRKSPWIAGGLSALFPGIGKFYAGYRGTPFGAMYMTLPLALVAIEAVILAGVLSPQFLVLGALFGVFYVGNIWGSALSVFSIKKEIFNEIDRNIIYDMHIPLRRVFWQ